MNPEVDKQLYLFRKQIDNQIHNLSAILQSIDNKKAWVEKIIKLRTEKNIPETDAILNSAKEMLKALNQIRAKGEVPRPKRQLGAWQSFETSPHSRLLDVKRISMAQTTMISEQQKQMLEEATKSIDLFSKEVNAFNNEIWEPFETSIKKNGINLTQD